MSEPGSAARRLPRGCWQAFVWYGSATLMTLAHHGFNGGHASPFLAAWFAGVAALWSLAFTFGALEQAHADPTDTAANETVHRCPPDGWTLMPCCGRTPFEVATTDRMTSDPKLVTCGK